MEGNRCSFEDRSYSTWDHRDLTYCFTNYYTKYEVLPVADIRSAIEGAFAKWAAVTPLTFTEVSEDSKNVDIRIRWVEGKHGDDKPFDGPGANGCENIAHAFYPPTNKYGMLAGDFHLDGGTSWSVDKLSIVALHELGHSLGLGHSQLPEAVMWQHYRARTLHADDIIKIQKKYGKREPQWLQLLGQSDTAQIVAGGGNLYRRDSNGDIWQHAGGRNWNKMDGNKDTAEIAANSMHLYQRHCAGSVWRPCKVNQWEYVDDGPGNVQIATGRGCTNPSQDLYQRHKDGSVWRYSQGQPWEWLDKNKNTVDIAANRTQLFLRHFDGGVFLYVDKPGDWMPITRSSDVKTVQIVAEGNKLYRRRSDGKVFSFTPEHEWLLVLDNKGTDDMAADDENLYVRHSTGYLLRYSGTPGVWQNLDAWHQDIAQMAAGDGKFYYQRSNGEIWQLMG